VLPPVRFCLSGTIVDMVALGNDVQPPSAFSASPLHAFPAVIAFQT
jgi:hypothetical protein